jgi:hypothetical protein
MSAFANCSSLDLESPLDLSKATIDQYAFLDCSSFSGPLLINSSWTSIPEYAFAGCQFVGDLDLSNITNIGPWAFADCTFDGILTLNEGLTAIPANAFYGCGFTNTLNLPNLESIGDFAFYNCSLLTLNLSPNIQLFYVSSIRSLKEINMLATRDENLNTTIRVSSGENLTATNLPPGITLTQNSDVPDEFILSGTFTDTGAFSCSFFVNAANTNQNFIGTFSLIGDNFVTAEDPPAFVINFDVEPNEVCFLSNCDVVLSDLSLKNITHLTVDDEVLGFISKTPQKIKKILNHLHKTDSLQETNKPYLIPKSSFGENIPDKNIHVSGHHRIILSGGKDTYLGVQAFKLDKCKKETQPPTEVVYYHIILENKGEGLLINNLPVEDCID